MTYVLDTNGCIFLMNRARPELARRVLQVSPGDIALSAIVVAELVYGAAKSQRPAEARMRLELLLGAFPLVPFDMPAVEAYGTVRARLERAGTPIGPLDTLIAAHAVSLDATLVTNNVREFRRVKGLRVEDWSV